MVDLNATVFKHKRATTMFKCKRRFGWSWFSGAVLVATGCSPSLQSSAPLYERLAGRGPVLLAPDNPYLPANRLFDEQLRSSEAFREQVVLMGRPAALSVERDLFSPTEVVLYYPELGQQVAFVKRGSEWKREDPLTMLSEERDQIARALNLLPPEEQESSTAALGITETTLEPRAMLAPSAVSSREKAPTHRTASLRKLSNGDYEHKVTFPGETLTLLADWYTGKKSNAGALAKASVRGQEQRLTKGARIVIPKRLMNNPSALPEAALR